MVGIVVSIYCSLTHSLHSPPPTSTHLHSLTTPIILVPPPHKPHSEYQSTLVPGLPLSPHSQPLPTDVYTWTYLQLHTPDSTSWGGRGGSALVLNPLPEVCMYVSRLHEPIPQLASITYLDQSCTRDQCINDWWG